jgi:hypothetical protein
MLMAMWIYLDVFVTSIYKKTTKANGAMVVLKILLYD